MARLQTYPVDSVIHDEDIVIGSEGLNQEYSTKNYTMSAVADFAKSKLNLAPILVLQGKSNVNQEPAELGEVLQVTFGAAQGTISDPVQLLADGTIVFNESGLYLFNGYGNFERVGSSGGVSVTAFRALLNGVAIMPPKAVELDTPGVMIPYELTVPINATAGDELVWEIMRDSSGVNQGGLYTHALLDGWGTVPSTDVAIWKIGI